MKHPGTKIFTWGNTMRYLRLRLTTAVLSAVISVPVLANTWPSKPITIVIPGAPGTAADILGRRVGEQLTKDYGKAVVVDNKPGAGGLIAYNQVKRASPDGYTVTIAVGGISIAGIMYKKAGIDPIKDFSPITQLALTPMVFVARPDSPLNSISDLLEAARLQPGKLLYGSFGTGSTSHLVGESFKAVGNVNIDHVPYKSGILAAPDVVSGQLDFAIIDPLAAGPFIKDGRLKALGVAGPARMPSLPDVPTVAESGVQFSAVGWVGLFGPADLPDEIASKINESANRAMAAPAQRQLLANGGSLPVEPAPTLDQWRTQFQDYVAAWSKVAQDAKMGEDQGS
jgi:tripartite-type tricarboxylate transporter receptor subunit TctC